MLAELDELKNQTNSNSLKLLFLVIWIQMNICVYIYIAMFLFWKGFTIFFHYTNDVHYKIFTRWRKLCKKKSTNHIYLNVEKIIVISILFYFLSDLFRCTVSIYTYIHTHIFTRIFFDSWVLFMKLWNCSTLVIKLFFVEREKFSLISHLKLLAVGGIWVVQSHTGDDLKARDRDLGVPNQQGIWSSLVLCPSLTLSSLSLSLINK